MLDEALDDSQGLTDEGPTPPKMTRRTSSPGRRGASSPSGTSAGSWEYETPASTSGGAKRPQKDFKTPRIDALSESPQVFENSRHQLSLPLSSATSSI